MVDMNIIIIGNFSYPQGMAGTKRIQHFIDFLTAQGIPIRILLLRQGSGKIPRYNLNGNFKGVPYTTIGNDLGPSPALFLRLIPYLWTGFLKLLNWKQTHARNILFVYGGPNIENILFILFAKFLGYKIVCDLVEDHSLLKESLPLLSRIKLKSILLFQSMIPKLSDGITVISSHLKLKYDQMFGQTIPIIHIPVSAKISDSRPKKQFNTPMKLIYSGSFAAKDGVDYLVEAFENVYKSTDGITLLLTGRGESKSIIWITQKSEQNKGIKYLGYLNDDEFYHFLNDADILCMIRKGSEYANAGFPFKLGEYLATGNPVIATNVGDVALYLENMKDAFIVTPDNITEIEHAIRFIMDNPEKALQIGHSGQRKCKEFFDPKKNGELLLDLFSSI